MEQVQKQYLYQKYYIQYREVPLVKILYIHNSRKIKK